MIDTFVNYRSFNDKALATELYTRLKEGGFPVEWEDSEGYFDVSFANNEFFNMYYVKLKKEDFQRADKLLLSSVNEEHDKPGEDYYLYTFTSEELEDVLNKTDEWNEYDRFWAAKILQKKGVEIKEEKLVEGRARHVNELRKPWRLDKFWVFCVLVLFIVAAAFFHVIWAAGVAFTGLYIAYSKKTLPTGDRVNAFSDTDRKAGRIILVSGIILVVFILTMALSFGLGFVDFVSFF